MAYTSFLIDLKEKGIKVNLQIWDTSGQEVYRELVSLFYRDAHSAIIVFDLSDIESINGVEFWINKLLEKVDPDEIIIKIIGNKSDSLD